MVSPCRQGKITACYRKKWEIHIERLQRDKTNGGTVNIGFHPSKVEVVKLKMDKSRKKILERKNRASGEEKVCFVALCVLRVLHVFLLEPWCRVVFLVRCTFPQHERG